MNITTHAIERGRERHGTPRRALQRLAALAIREGTPREFTGGSLRRYLDKIASNQPGVDLRIHGKKLFVFKGGYLVTTWPLPEIYWGCL
jgi:hypothetical protein